MRQNCTAKMSAERLDTSLPLLFVEDLEEPEIEKADRHHFERVLRVKYGDSINISDARGSWRKCVFGSQLEGLEEIYRQEISTGIKTGVGFSPLKGGRTDFVVAKLTELGIDYMTPFFAERSVVRPDSKKIASQVQRWEKIAREAAMQSRRLYLPEIRNPMSFAELASDIRESSGAAEGKPAAKTARCDRAGSQLNFSGADMEFSHLLIGPEGGWEENERKAIETEVCLGENILRSDTAAIVAGAFLVQLKNRCLNKP